MADIGVHILDAGVVLGIFAFHYDQWCSFLRMGVMRHVRFVCPHLHIHPFKILNSLNSHSNSRILFAKITEKIIEDH